MSDDMLSRAPEIELETATDGKVALEDVAQVLLACHHNMIQAFLGGSGRSGAPHNHFAKVSVQRLDDRESRANERVGRICRRNKHPDRGSDNEGVAPNHRLPSVGWRSTPPLAAW